MPILAETKDNRTILHIESDMTIYAAAELKAELTKQLATTGEQEIDLSQVSEMDCAGLQLLLLAKREAQRKNQLLRLTGHSPAVMEVINICNLAACLDAPVQSAD